MNPNPILGLRVMIRKSLLRQQGMEQILRVVLKGRISYYLFEFFLQILITSKNEFEIYTYKCLKNENGLQFLLLCIDL